MQARVRQSVDHFLTVEDQGRARMMTMAEHGVENIDERLVAECPRQPVRP